VSSSDVCSSDLHTHSSLSLSPFLSLLLFPFLLSPPFLSVCVSLSPPGLYLLPFCLYLSLLPSLSLSIRLSLSSSPPPPSPPLSLSLSLSLSPSLPLPLSLPLSLYLLSSP